MTPGPADVAALMDELWALPPSQRPDRARGADTDGTLLLDLADEAARRTTGDAEQAVQITAMVCDLADHFEEPLARARSRRASARALAYAGRLDEALAVCDEAAGIAAAHGHPTEAARARLASMHALTELGRHDAAIEVGKAARDMFVAVGEPALAARADINLGVVYQRGDDPASAVRCFEDARGPLESEPLVLGHLDNNRGEALLALNDFDGARQAFEAARQAFEDADAPITAAIAEGNLADLAARRGHLRDALLHFERARRRLEAHRSPSHLARLLAEQCEAKAILGLPQEALVEYEAALPELDRCGLALEAARARGGMGHVLLRMGRLTEAETALAAAGTAFQELGHATARARIDLLRAELMMVNRRREEARRLVLRSLAALHDRPAESIAARHLLARLALDDGDTALAAGELEVAVGLARRLDLPPLRADLLLTRSRLHRLDGRLPQAIADLQAAARAVEAVRGTLQAERLRAAYLGRWTGIHERLIDALLEQAGPGAAAEAFAVTEQAKSRSLLDQMNAVFALDAGMETSDSADATAAPLQSRLEDLQSRLNASYSRLADDPVAHRAAGEEHSILPEIRKLESELESIRTRLSVTSGKAGLHAPTVLVEQAQEKLDTRWRLLEYMSIDDELLAFVVSPESVSVHRGLASVDSVVGSLARLRFQIDRALRPGAERSRRLDRLVTDAQEELAELHQSLVAPLSEALAGSNRLTIVPHGPLHLVPFHALWDGRQYLIQSHDVHYAPSASVLCQLAPLRGDDSDQSALVVGVPDEIAPEIAGEAAAVAALLGSGPDRRLIGAAATVEAVQRCAGRTRLLHLACHARYDAAAPMSCGLRLADRWLTVRDIYAMRLDAELVTLSGCETGVNSVTAGDELIGLLRGFFAAGARSVLASLWRTHDQCTAQLMCNFYRQWAGAGSEPSDKARALRRVQLEAMSQWPHPAWWAPFILVGQP